METVDIAKTMRVFFALWPAQREQQALAGWQAPLRDLCGGKAMRAKNLHATLVFVGDVAENGLEALNHAAQGVRGQKFEVTFDQARYWRHNHIIHAAPTHVPDALNRLVADLEQSLRHHHFRFDSHSRYKPHVTLLRHAKWRGTALPPMRPSRWHMQSFALVQSVSGNDGVSYQVIAEFPLI